MNALQRFIVICFGLIVAIGMSILVLSQGWGLQPKSWWWIIGCGFFGQIFAHLIVELGKTDKE